MQLNDVYEITPVEGGKRGGLARVATILNQLESENPNTYAVMAGDFVSPSALGTAKVDGERLAGKQMIAALNTMGLDYATFGNHEFDIDKDQLLDRIDESEFAWITANVFDEANRSFPGSIPYEILKAPTEAGDTLRVALLGVTAPIMEVDYITYGDYTEILEEQVAGLHDEADVFVALTHHFLAQDVALANDIPELDLIMGGHDHENIQLWRGPDLTPIAKADANARTVYVHRLIYDFETRALTTESKLELVTDAIPDDSATAAIVDQWVDRAWEGFRASGFKPEETVVTTTEPLDGRESAVRNHPTTLTRIIADGMKRAADSVDVAIFNSGSIRIDDVLPPGAITEYDVIRVLPFGGQVVSVEMTGMLLDSVLTQGVDNKGTGGYLQSAGATQNDVIWQLDDGPVLPNRTYRVAFSDFLLTGNEANLGYLTYEHPGITKIAEHGDIRKAVIAELERRY